MIAVRIVVALEAGEVILPALALLENLLRAIDVHPLAVVKCHRRDLRPYNELLDDHRQLVGADQRVGSLLRRLERAVYTSPERIPKPRLGRRN
jgi:RecB family exonuclease